MIDYTAAHQTRAFETLSTTELTFMFEAMMDGNATVEELKKFKTKAAPQRRKQLQNMVVAANEQQEFKFDIENGYHVAHLLILGSITDFFKAQRGAHEVRVRAAEADKAAEAAVNTSKKPKAEKKPKGPTIRSVAEALLVEVVGHDVDGRPLSHSYEVILEKIREQFPNAKTTVACLRWYAVHMRAEEIRVPQRPRAQAATQDAE